MGNPPAVVSIPCDVVVLTQLVDYPLPQPKVLTQQLVDYPLLQPKVLTQLMQT
jgi:hypothetical protein